MLLFKKPDPFSVLEDILDREHTAILGGNFDALGKLMTEKEQLFSIMEIPQSGGNLARLKNLADRNQSMLLAASKGIRTVSDLLVRQPGSNELLQTYSESGERLSRGSDPNNLTRRV